MDTSFLQNYGGIKSFLCLDVLEPTSKGFIYKEGAKEKLGELKDKGIEFEITKQLLEEF